MTMLAGNSTNLIAQRPLIGQILCFGMVGTVGFIINAAIVAVLSVWTGPAWAQVFAFPVAVTTTWALNRRYTFQAGNRPRLREWAIYGSANSLGWAANNGVYFALILSLPFIYRHAVLAVAAGSLAGMGFNFVMSKKIVFGQDKKKARV